MTPDGNSRLFFAYPSRPRLRAETIREAARKIGGLGHATRTWEDLGGPGRLVIKRILEEIDGSDVVVADVTDLNQNVLFELGYAVGRERLTWVLRDPGDVAADRLWNEVGLLTTVSWVKYANSDDLRAAFLRDQPHEGKSTIYDDLIGAALGPSANRALFYLKSISDNEASRRLSGYIDSLRSPSFQVGMADPSESSAQPLAWYAQAVYDADVVVAHFESPARRGAPVHNARYAFVCGLAVGMRRNVLMLAQEDYSPPIDYRDYLFVYSTAQECVNRAEAWLQPVIAKRASQPAPPRRQLSAELADLRLGAHVAENEEETLSDYFVETAQYREVLSATAMVFVGRKGTGKSANLIRASQDLASDKRNLVVVLRPPGYELDAVLRLLAAYSEKDAKGYLVESLWKFLLFTEIARAAVLEIERRPAGAAPGSAEWNLVQFAREHEELVMADFAVRLEAAVESVLRAPVDHVEGVGDFRARISEALHHGVLRVLRQHLGQVLTSRTRVAVLVDNLDKTWERSSDLSRLSQFLLGLIGSVRPIAAELGKSDRWRDPVRTTLAVFVRSDIFARVVDFAREPDKLPVTRILWTDRELLARVVEDRFVAARGGDAEPTELWRQFFCDSVDDIPTRTRLLARALPRPRDIVFLCNAAITAAINHRHVRVEADDVREAELQYSRFAIDTIKVEEGGGFADIEQRLYEFAGAPAVMSADDVLGRLGRVDSAGEPIAALETLVALSFLGTEVRPGDFVYADDPREQLRASAIAKRGVAGVRYAVHPAFRPYLEVVDDWAES